jgi:hypothetical protein
MCVCPAAKKVQRGGEARKGFLLQAGRAAARSERVIKSQWPPTFLVGPSALAAPAFEHVDDSAGVGNHDRPDMPEFFIAEAAGLGGLVHDGGNLLGAK